jgi:hypothetical protein
MGPLNLGVIYCFSWRILAIGENGSGEVLRVDSTDHESIQLFAALPRPPSGRRSPKRGGSHLYRKGDKKPSEERRWEHLRFSEKWTITIDGEKDWA